VDLAIVGGYAGVVHGCTYLTQDVESHEEGWLPVCPACDKLPLVAADAAALV
jgi:hypothetical protein